MSAGLMQAVGAMSRTLRKPQHKFQVRSRPWQIQPFMIAPVLPGETLKNLLMQSRVVTDPIKNPLIGWWVEYYFFYVKHRDLDQRDNFVQMMLDPDYDTATMNTAARTETYHYGATIDWTEKCLNRVVDEYFRNEGEATLAGAIGTLPAASVHPSQENWMDSLMDDTTFKASLPDDGEIVVGADDKITAPEIDAAMRAWQWAKGNGLTDQTYEDFLRTYGVRLPKEEVHKPELVRYLKEWTYPSNTINPADGKPTSACSWAVSERADKDRFFKEPGFIFGVTVTRPKVYLSKQVGSAVGVMNDAMAWLPAVLRDDPYTSMKHMLDGTGPIQHGTDAAGYWLDVRDLLLYGDQFVNFALTEVDAGFVALPTAALGKRYATATDADALFVTPATLNKIRQDGVVTLNVASTQQDSTAQT